MDGNFFPISEEFELLVAEDPFINSHLAHNNLILYSKGKSMEYYDLSKQDIKAKIREYKELAEYIIDRCEVGFAYFDYLCYTIINNIFLDNSSYESKELIYNLSRMLVTELVNSGYSQDFIQETTRKFFFSPDKKIECNRDTLIEFFNCFSNEIFTFRFKFMVNHKMSRIFEKLDNFEIGELSPNELEMLRSQKKRAQCVIVTVKDVDCFSAHRQALDIIQTVLSLHNLNQHNSQLYVSSSAIVSKILKDGKVHSEFVVNKTINLMKKRGNTSYLHALYNDVVLLNKTKLPSSFMRAISLHNVAIECKDISNQLLNLWTLVEVLITTKRDNEDRINTICNVLRTILNRNYLYSNIEQLLRDIKTCTNSELTEIFSTIQSDTLDDVERLALILSVKKYETERTKIISLLEDYPLLTHRIIRFSDTVFVDSQSIYNFLHRHTKKIHWHIMRIYRNRNMIVHNGSYMPYRNQLVENLHYYVDTLLDTLIEYYCMGFKDENSIYRDMICSETVYYEKLGLQVMNKKDKFKPVQLSEDNALVLIFGGYR